MEKRSRTKKITRDIGLHIDPFRGGNSLTVDQLPS